MRIMRGYRHLKDSKSLNRIADVNRALPTQVLDIKEKQFSKYIFGEGIDQAEVICRQYLLTRVAGLSLNRALLHALGKPGSPVFYYLPSEWRKTLRDQGFKVAFFRTALLWNAYTAMMLAYGIFKIVNTILIGIKAALSQYKQQLGRYVMKMNPIPLSETDIVAFCPLCRSRNILIIQEPHERRIFVTDGDEMKVLIGVCGCGDCGFIFLSPRMSAPTLMDYYARQSRIPRGEIPANSPLMQLMDIQFDFLERHYPLHEGATVLEVGCAEGFFLNRIIERKGRNIQVSGVEPSRRYVKHASSLIPKCRFYENLLEEVEFGNERFDLVVMRHVFEHVLSPIRILKIVSGILKPTGAVFVEVPDAAIPVAGAFHFFHHEHLSYFTEETLTATFARAGFKSLCVEQFQGNPLNSGFDYPVLRAIAKLDRNARVENHPDQPRAVMESHRRSYEVFSEIRIFPLVRRLEDLHRMRKRLAIFGAGPHTMDLLDRLNLPTALWTVILDNNPAKQGKRLYGIPVDLPISERLSALDVVLVSSAAFEGEIVQQLKEIAPKKLEILTIYS